MNWYNKLIKLSQIQGEYWIDDSGNVVEADQGDYNHEGYVRMTLGYSFLSDFNIEDEYGQVGEHYDEIAKSILEENYNLDEIANMLREEGVKEPQLQQLISQNDFDTFVEILDSNEIIETYIKASDQETQDIWALLNEQGDARDYAMKYWGWSRLQGNNAEVWTLTPNSLGIISDGVYEAYGDDAMKAKFNIYTHSNKKWYQDVPWIVIDSKNPMALREYQFLG